MHNKINSNATGHSMLKSPVSNYALFSVLSDLPPFPPPCASYRQIVQQRRNLAAKTMVSGPVLSAYLRFGVISLLGSSLFRI